MSELGIELENEAWDSWLRDDLIRELQKQEGLEDWEPDPEFDLWNLYREACEETNTYPEVETGCSMFIRIEDLLPNITEMVMVRVLPARVLVKELGRDWQSKQASTEFESIMKNGGVNKVLEKANRERDEILAMCGD